MSSNDQSKKLDQFYTSPYIAKQCLDKLYTIINKNEYSFIEPSAGFGSFSSLVKGCLALDIDPKNENIIKQDFLESDNETFKHLNKKFCFFGNPPFGKNSSLAVKFFNHAAKYGDVIAFILPKTFRKDSIHNRLDLNFHLELDEDLPKNSFLFKDKEYDVPCCFQIWIKNKKTRIKSVNKTSDFISFVKRDDADFAIRRVGGRSGKAFKLSEELSEQSNYFIKLDSSKIKLTEAINLVNSINFQKIVNSTAGVRSLSKNELIEKLDKVFKRKIKELENE